MTGNQAHEIPRRQSGAHTVEEAPYLGVLDLWAIHFVALCRALRATSPAPAQFGSALGIMGFISLAAGALPRSLGPPISDLYHVPGATLEDQAGDSRHADARRGQLRHVLPATRGWWRAQRISPRRASSSRSA
jgi:hypothetical protein